jgi:hypothetical protein
MIFFSPSGKPRVVVTLISRLDGSLRTPFDPVAFRVLLLLVCVLAAFSLFLLSLVFSFLALHFFTLAPGVA